MNRTLALVGLGVAVVVTFAVQRGRSPFLRIEADAPLARSVADEFDLPLAEVMALRELAGVAVPLDELRPRIATFVAVRREYAIDALAVLAFACGERELERWIARCGGEPEAVVAALRPAAEGLNVVRFAAMCDRFAHRLASAGTR